MATLANCLQSSSQNPAIIVTGKEPREISHAALAENVKQLRDHLAAKSIRRGTKVSMVLTDNHAFTTAFLAFTLQSAIVAPLNPNLKTPEFETYIQDFGADLVVLSPEEVSKNGAAYTAAQKCNLPVATCSVSNQAVTIELPSTLSSSTPPPHDDLKPTPDVNDIALVLHTSGTTGKPKAVPLTHANIATSTSNIIHHYSLTPTDRAVVIMPLFHIHGLVAGLFAPLTSGGSILFSGSPQGGLSPSFLRDAFSHSATWYTATPTLHKLASQIPMKEDEVPKFRFIRSCSSRLEGSLLRQLEQRYACPVVEAYAMTEAAHQVSSNPVDFSGIKEGSVGLPVPGISIKILSLENDTELPLGQTGEISLSGPSVMQGYLSNPLANEKSFTKDPPRHFRTGDQGFLHPETGYLTLTGRIKELINKGGEKISPVEIDEVVHSHPGVEEAVAFSLPDEVYGEEVGLAVVLKGDGEVDEMALKEFVGERLMRAKVPKRVFFVERIPKTEVGKMQRGLVARRVLGGLE